MTEGREMLVIRYCGKIKLVVVNENSLGYINPNSPTYFCPLASSVIKGSRFDNINPKAFYDSDKIRLASEKDFDTFRVSFEGYKNDRDDLYEYAE